jgi:hypothetical protein
LRDVLNQGREERVFAVVEGMWLSIEARMDDLK